ncbi:MAG: hypothetical protein ABR608_06870, partial [Pseudonocardiaceae bacterium]
PLALSPRAVGASAPGPGDERTPSAAARGLGGGRHLPLAAELDSGRRTDLGEFVDVAAALVGPIDGFFEDVLVMADDPEVRANRLGLLAAVRELGTGVLAWEELN